MFKKICSAVFLLVAVVTANAQEFSVKNFKWDTSKEKAQLSEDEKKENALYLDFSRTLEYTYNEKGGLACAVAVYRRIYINAKEEIENFNKLYLEISYKENLLCFNARTISPKGVIKETKTEDLKEIEEEGKKVNIKVALEGVEEGSIIEYYYAYMANSRLYNSYFVQSSYYARRSEFKILSPSNLFFKIKGYNGFSNGEQKDGAEVNTLTAYANNVKGLKDQTYSHYQSYLMRVEFKLDRNSSNGKRDFNTFDAAAKEYYEVFVANNKPEKAVSKLIKQLDLKKVSKEVAIQRLEKYLKNNVNYIEKAPYAGLEAGIKNKYMNKDELTQLYCNVFAQLEIPFQIVLTSNKNENPFDTEFNSWNFLDEYLLYLPEYKKYLDPVNYFFRYGLTNFTYINNYGLFIKEFAMGDTKSGIANTQLIQVPDMSISESDLQSTVDLSNQESFSLNTMSTTGYMAVNTRPLYYYSDAETKEKLIEETAKIGWENVQIKDLKVQNDSIDEGGQFKPFVMEFKSIDEQLKEYTSNAFIFNIGRLIGKQAEMYIKEERMLGIDVEYPHIYKRTLKITLPDDYILGDYSNLNINKVYAAPDGGKLMGFVSKASVSGKELTVYIEEYYNFVHLEKDKFNDFKDVINAAADFSKLSISFKKK